MASATLEEALALRDPTPEAMSACAAILAGSDSDPWDVADIFEKLREWLRRDLDHAHRLLSGARLQATIVLALQRHGHNMEVARLGCGVVAGCCQKSNQNAALMLKAGVVQEILGLMDEHRGDGIVQDNACVALWRISERHGSGAEDIARADGLSRLFHAMQDHIANPFVQVNGCMAMERLYMKGGAPPAGMRAAAEKAMAAHPSNTQIKRGAKRLLEALGQPPLVGSTAGFSGAAVQPSWKSSDRGWAMTSHRAAAVRAGPAPGEDALNLKFHEWLMELDSVGFLMVYYGELRQNFDSLAQVVNVYAPAGELDPKFFADLGVNKLGHRRLFQKWCRDNLPHRLGAAE